MVSLIIYFLFLDLLQHHLQNFQIQLSLLRAILGKTLSREEFSPELFYIRHFCKLLSFIKKQTQVGSPAMRLRLARCTAWVKRWSEAMDFLQTIFKTNISLSGIFENYIIKG